MCKHTLQSWKLTSTRLEIHSAATTLEKEIRYRSCSD